MKYFYETVKGEHVLQMSCPQTNWANYWMQINKMSLLVLVYTIWPIPCRDYYPPKIHVFKWSLMTFYSNRTFLVFCCCSVCLNYPCDDMAWNFCQVLSGISVLYLKVIFNNGKTFLSGQTLICHGYVTTLSNKLPFKLSV